jgi:signal transduction histidine kinase
MPRGVQPVHSRGNAAARGRSRYRRAMAETLESGTREDPEVADSFLEIIIAEADRLARLTDDILDLTRYESGRLDMQEVDVNQLLATVVQQVQPDAAQSGLELISQVDDLPPNPGRPFRAAPGPFESPG